MTRGQQKQYRTLNIPLVNKNHCSLIFCSKSSRNIIFYIHMYVCMYLFIPIFMPLLLLELSIFVHLVIYLPGYDNAHTHRMTHVCVYLICCSSSYTQNHLSVFFLLLFLMWFQLYKWIHWIWSINWVNEELNEWTNVLHDSFSHFLTLFFFFLEQVINECKSLENAGNRVQFFFYLEFRFLFCFFRITNESQQ